MSQEPKQLNEMFEGELNDVRLIEELAILESKETEGLDLVGEDKFDYSKSVDQHKKDYAKSLIAHVDNYFSLQRKFAKALFGLISIWLIAQCRSHYASGISDATVFYIRSRTWACRRGRWHKHAIFKTFYIRFLSWLMQNFRKPIYIPINDLI